MQLQGLALNDMGRCDEAIELFDLILAKENRNIYALTAKGQALLGLGEYAESLIYFDKTLAIAPETR
jgi:tetratricopeptide (TPR) repeat protein